MQQWLDLAQFHSIIGALSKIFDLQNIAMYSRILAVRGARADIPIVV